MRRIGIVGLLALASACTTVAFDGQVVALTYVQEEGGVDTLELELLYRGNRDAGFKGPPGRETRPGGA